ncbi:DoxX family protein [Nocardioides sp. JQ2195]|uniref:DoxX family protein n=1 Tax=Nocardioides sp. JQ2195 TaxID=2592334 RepID=UPI00143E24D6|nr:DoxX family protein [Nocardioides sp. JQ2195]QIX25218.1 DoxX family protein [Nocardioides sp. JQ2195]
MLLGNRTPQTLQDTGLALGRLVIGALFIAHGWQKISEFGMEGTASSFDMMGVPLPEAAAYAAAAIEVGGGVLLVLGLLTPVASLLLVVDMVGAFWFAHREAGPFVADGGWELVAALGAAALVIGLVGPGRFSLDGLVGRRSTVSTPATA